MNKYKIENSNNKEVQGYEFRLENSKSLIRKVLLLIAFIFFSIINLKATEQVSDLLIIKNDTFVPSKVIAKNDKCNSFFLFLL